jgi:hypothetical protein
VVIGIMGWRWRERGPLQEIPKAGMQGIEIDVFNGNLVVGAIGPVLAAAALGLAHANPVGRPVTSTRKAVAFHEGFQQINGMAVFALPVAT